MIAMASSHTCAVRESGEIACWGRASEAAPEPPPMPLRAIAVAAGELHTCAIRESGEVLCWEAGNGVGSPPDGEFRAISMTSALYACAIRESGEIACWGDEFLLGRMAGQRAYAADILDMFEGIPGNYRSLSSGYAHTCAIGESGELACWGWNGDGQTDAPSGKFRAVSAGTAHTCAIRESGELACWGWNDEGQTDAPAGTFRAVSAGRHHTCAVRESGDAVCWGGNEGDLPAPELYETPCEPGGRSCWSIRIADDTARYPLRTLVAGSDAICGVLESGDLLCWGDYADDAPRYRFRSLSAGIDGHFCGITETSRVYCWGYDNAGKTNVPEEPPPAP